MTIAHSLDGPLSAGSSSTPARHTDGAASAAKHEPPRTPIPIDPPRPAWARQPGMEARAQTWVQITLLAVLAALVAFIMALPERRLSRATIEAQRSLMELRLTLAELRTVIGDYRAEHGRYPGHGVDGGEDPAWFERQWNLALQRADERAGADLAVRPAPITRPGGVPLNPINGLSSVRFLRADEPWPTAPDDTTGWIYRPSTGEIRANTRGSSSWSGASFWEL